MESRVTVGLAALNASAHSFLLAQVTGEFPASWRNVRHTVDRFNENRIGKTDFRDPDGADNVPPAIVVRSLKRTTFIRTEYALGDLGGRI